MKPRPALFAGAACVELLLVSLASGYGDFVRKGEALIFVPLMLLAGVAFFCAVRFFESVRDGLQSRTLWGIAIGLRILMLPCSPGDDLWRYAWEGRVQNAGANPYTLAPAASELAHLRDAHWPKINHREVAAIYPPAAELLFAAVTRISPSQYLFKLLFAAADLLTLALLLRLVNPIRAAWYAWNPAVVYAFTGAAHYDSLMLLALTAAVVGLNATRSQAPLGNALAGEALLRAEGASVGAGPVDAPACGTPPPCEAELCSKAHSQAELGNEESLRWQLASVLCLSAAISLKLIPAILLPVWAFTLGKRAWLLAFCAVPAALAIPFGGLATTLQPLRDFADVSRFNELLVWIFPNPWQRNWPVNVLLCVTIAVIVVRFRHDWPRAALWTLGAALVLSPVLHPWYATWMLPLAIWRRAPAWTVLSISTLAAFLLWETTSLWTEWQPNFLTRAIVILPPLLAWRFQSKFHEPAHV